MLINDSERLRYDFITDADADFLFELDQDPEVMRFINKGKVTPREDVDTVFLPRLAAYANRALCWGLWKVSIKADNSPAIGWILVRPMGFFTANPEIDNIELGWRFTQASWGKGYATEAAKAVMEAINQSGVNQFSAIALPDNVASIAIMKKLGMTYSHTHRYVDEIFDDEVVVYTRSVR